MKLRGSITFSKISKWINDFVSLYESNSDKWYDYVVYGVLIASECAAGAFFDGVGSKLKQPMLKNIEGSSIEVGVDIFNQFWSDGLEAAWEEWEDAIKDWFKEKDKDNVKKGNN